MKFTIFYSWQSDLPNNTNRGFLESVIEKAIKDIGRDKNFEIEPSLDRDTKGVPGAPNISHTILEKIKTCDVFVADISIVTGDKEKNQRLSPNPNVLIELGYAVSILGWEKIILICNEIYGKGEDLPFDIRQHRRIAYCLQPDNGKAPVREELSKHLKDRIAEIIRNSNTSIGDAKEPDLFIEWNLLNQGLIKKARGGLQTIEVIMPTINEVVNIEDSVKRDIEEISDLDGSIDPKWEAKVNEFKNESEKFLQKIQTSKGIKNYFIDSFSHLATLLTISVTNNGALPASDIRVEIPLPDWILVFEKRPDKYDIPKRPVMPTPTPPKRGLTVVTGNLRDIHAMFDDSVLGKITKNHNRTSACYIKNDNTIFLWADKLLHKHTLTISEDSFFMLAKPEAMPGEYDIECKCFCVEYNDWRKSLIKIIVQQNVAH